MVNELFMPSFAASARRIRTHIEWNVETHIDRARGPTSAATRSFISPAALLVKVVARIGPAVTPRSAYRKGTRWVRARFLPEPAPATMSNGPPEWTTAARCWGFKPSRSVAGSTASRTPGRRFSPGSSGRANRASAGWFISAPAYLRPPTPAGRRFASASVWVIPAGREEGPDVDCDPPPARRPRSIVRRTEHEDAPGHRRHRPVVRQRRFDHRLRMALRSPDRRPTGRAVGHHLLGDRRGDDLADRPGVRRAGHD